GILAALSGDPGAPSAERWLRLAELPVIEPYPHAGAGAGKVAETSRLVIRKRLAEDQRARLAELSGRSARAFEGDTRPMGRVSPSKARADRPLSSASRARWSSARRFLMTSRLVSATFPAPAPACG